MISVVNTNGATTMSNPYSRMSLAETCSSLVLEANNIVNDLQMDILLNEHQYLYENAVEISYVNEDGSDNNNTVKLKDKILNALSEFGKKIMAAFDKAIEWVKEFIDNFIIELRKRFVSKKHYDQAVAAFEKVFKNGMAATDVAPYTVDYEDFKAQWAMYFRFGNDVGKVSRKVAKADKEKAANSTFNDVDVSPSDLYPIFVHDSDISSKKITKDDLKEAGEVIFSKSIVKDITRTKHEADKSIKAEMGRVKSTGGDKMADELNNLSAQIKENSKVASSAIRVYHAYVRLQLNIVKAVFNRAEIKQAIADNNSKEKKENSKNLADSLRNKFQKKDVNESAYDYDGKYFRV